MKSIPLFVSVGGCMPRKVRGWENGAPEWNDVGVGGTGVFLYSAGAENGALELPVVPSAFIGLWRKICGSENGAPEWNDDPSAGIGLCL